MENDWRYEHFELPKIIIAGNWNPLNNLKQSHQLEEGLMKEGKYNSKYTDFTISKLGFMGAEKIGADTIRIIYGTSILYEDILGQGKTEQEAIVDAAVHFSQNRERYKRNAGEISSLLERMF